MSRLSFYALSIVLLIGGCTGANGDEPPPAHVPIPCARELPERTAFIAMPDTQFYACSYDEIFEAQTRFIADNVDTIGLGIVVHTGDIVDTNDQAQWDVASRALHVLDGRVPYLLAPGNHDIDGARNSLIDRYFAPADLDNAGCAQLGFKDAGRVENSFAVVELRSERWLFVGLEFAPRDAVIDWANDVLREHQELRAVLFTHAYLYADEQRYDRAIQPLQPYHPDIYGVTPSEGIGDGQDIFEAVVEPNENVRLVLSGHVVPDGTARATRRRASGSVVHEVLANYQSCDFCPCERVEGGGGYLRILELSESGDSVHVSTYSPHLGHALTDAENDFVLPL
jgi:hypothetical protein